MEYRGESTAGRSRYIVAVGVIVAENCAGVLAAERRDVDYIRIVCYQVRCCWLLLACLFGWSAGSARICVGLFLDYVRYIMRIYTHTRNDRVYDVYNI